jgi:general nucleoside transport system permease protein
MRLSAVVVMLVAVAVPTGFVMLAGRDPLASWTTLLGYTLGSWAGFSEVLVTAIPLTLIGLGLAVAFRAGIFNIGADGQLIAGAVLAVALAPLLPPAGPLAFLAAGFVGGALLGALVGWLRARFGANEIIVTIMLNYVAIQLLAWVIRGPLQEPMRLFPRSAVIPESLHLPLLVADSRVHAGLLLALIAAAALALVFSRTGFGYRLAVVGTSRGAAAYAGIRERVIVILAMLLSGGFAGLAGAAEIAGIHQRLEDNFAEGYGLIGIAVALMARLNPLAVPFAALLFGVFQVGSSALQRELAVPYPIVWIFAGTIVLAVLALQCRSSSSPA